MVSIGGPPREGRRQQGSEAGRTFEVHDRITQQESQTHGGRCAFGGQVSTCHIEGQVSTCHMKVSEPVEA